MIFLLEWMPNTQMADTITTQPLNHNLNQEGDEYRNMLQKMIDLKASGETSTCNQDFFKKHLQKIVDHINGSANKKYDNHKKQVKQNIEETRKAIQDGLPLDFIEAKIKKGINDLTFPKKQVNITLTIELSELVEMDNALKSLLPKVGFSSKKFNLEFQSFRKLVRKYEDVLNRKMYQIAQSLNSISKGKVKVEVINDPKKTHSFKAPNGQLWLTGLEMLPNDCAFTGDVHILKEMKRKPLVVCEPGCKNVETNCTCDGLNVSFCWCCNQGVSKLSTKLTNTLTNSQSTNYCGLAFPCWLPCFPCWCVSTVKNSKLGVNEVIFNELSTYTYKRTFLLTLEEIPGPEIKVEDVQESDLVSLYSVSSLPTYLEIYPQIPTYESLERDLFADLEDQDSSTA